MPYWIPLYVLKNQQLTTAINYEGIKRRLGLLASTGKAYLQGEDLSSEFMYKK